MTILPKILQVFFWRSNRLYTAVIHNKKLYGIFLAGQFHDIETVSFVVDFVVTMLVILPIWFGLISILHWVLSQVGIKLVADFTIIFEIIAWGGGFYLYDLYRSTAIYQKISTKIYNFFNLKFNLSSNALTREKLGLEQIEQASEREFLESNPKNFMIDLVAIEKIKISPKNSWVIWPETHFGYFKLILNPGNKTNKSGVFALKEDGYTETLAALDHAQIKLEEI